MHMDIMREFDIFIPKHHVILHAFGESDEKGNPWFYGSWLDESLNKLLKSCCRHAKPATFEETVLSKATELLKEDLHVVQSRKRAAED
jgi:hypothetical protein